MKVRTANSTGRPEPQFLIEAENDNDRQLLKMFLCIKDQSKIPLEFKLHGITSNEDGYNSFNFGWAEKKRSKV